MTDVSSTPDIAVQISIFGSFQVSNSAVVETASTSTGAQSGITIIIAGTTSVSNAGTLKASGNIRIGASNSLLITGGGTSGILQSNSVVLSSSAGSVTGDQQQILAVDGTSAGILSGSANRTGFEFTIGEGPLSVGTITVVQPGNVLIVLKEGALSVVGQVTAGVAGNVTIQNDDTGSGSIELTSGSQLRTTLGNINVVIGPPPSTPVVGSAPSSSCFTPNVSNGGAIFYGTNGNSARNRPPIPLMSGHPIR